MSEMVPKRTRITRRIADGFMELLDLDMQTDSPDPLLTSLAGGLTIALTMVRVALAHARKVDSYEEVIKMARELEEDGWKEHREKCARCGVQ